MAVWKNIDLVWCSEFCSVVQVCLLMVHKCTINILCVDELQRNDIAMAITKYDQFDFLIDIVPREEIRPAKRLVSYILVDEELWKK